MSNQIAALQKRAVLAWFAVAALLIATVLPMLAQPRTVQAAEVQNRSVNISDSVAGATDVTYSVSFDTGSAGNVDAMVLQYCDDSPIVGDANCADARSFSWFNAAATDIALANQVGITNWTVDTVNTDSNTLILTRSGAPAAGDPGASTTISFDVGAGGATDGVTNPTGANTSFYVRILTYDTVAAAQAYAPGTPGANRDDGGIALSTASQLTINARVQEVLTFTVGTDDAADNCAALAGDTIDLGVLDTSGINRASTDPTADTNVGCAEVTTNAANGVQIYYVGDDLKVSGATCAGSTDDDAGTASDVDQCINRDGDADAGTLTTGISAGDELWGIGISNVGTNAIANVTNNLTEVAAYDIDTAAEYSFVPNTATEFANSATVVNQETIEIDAAATASITTPTGLYSTTLTFIATATF